MNFSTPYEVLGPDGFQRFCQSLLAAEFPQVQVVPLYRGDGGRDAFARSTISSDVIIFQCKWVENAHDLKNISGWLPGIMKREAPHISRLAGRGVGHYRLLTNALGGPSPQGGSIDEVDTIMREYLAGNALGDKVLIPDIQCWWRTDLDTRLAQHPHLRWEFPQLLTGSHVLQSLLEGGLSEDTKRRTLAVRTFVTDQRDADKIVRFRQVDLDHNDLFALWIDPPLNGDLSSEHHTPPALNGDERWPPSPDSGVGEALLSLPSTPTAIRIMLHGAPGQGKSTLTQYICQVHRAALLAQPSARAVPSQSSQLRLPIRAELPHFAQYLSGGDPFVAGARLLVNHAISLEGFLAHLIETRSGGGPFSVADLRAVCASSPVLLALDGLDEVGNADEHAKVVREVDEGVARLDAITPSLHVVVTSRPTTAQVARFTPALWTTWELAPLESVHVLHVLAYAANWTSVRMLADEESASLTATLRARLSDEDFRHLVRNVMQLSIVVHLLSKRGAGLPDRRGELYDAYMELYLDREADKSDVVKNHRRLLLEMHGHLGFVIHARAELSASRAALSVDELKVELDTHLRDLGLPPDLLDEVFAGVVDRVMALVARQPEMFDFEVQPLREYFAARHLYDFAPQARYGEVVRGTRPERFEVLLRNPFWLNVGRFFAGAYQTGELSSLVDALEDLAEDPEWGRTNHASTVGATLLRDRVFDDVPRARKRLMKVCVSGMPHFRVPPIGRSSPDSLPLSDPQMHELAVGRALASARRSAPADRVAALATLLAAAHSQKSVRPTWQTETASVPPDIQSSWLIVSGSAGVFDSGDAATLRVLDLEAMSGDAAWYVLQRAPDVLVNVAGQESRALEAVLKKGLPVASPVALSLNVVQRVALALNKLRTCDDRFFRQYAMQVMPCEESTQVGIQCSRMDAAVRSTGHLQPAARFLQAAQRELGDCLLFDCAALHLVATNRLPTQAVDVGDDRQILAHAVSLARHSADSEYFRWWREQLTLPSARPALALFAWGGPSVLNELLPLLNESVERMPEDVFLDWRAATRSLPPWRAWQRPVAIPEGAHPRVKVLLSPRIDASARAALARAHLKSEPTDMGVTMAAIEELLGAGEDVGGVSTIRDIYAARSEWAPAVSPDGLRAPFEEICEILESPTSYPLTIVTSAAREAYTATAAGVRSLAAIASEAGWFAAKLVD